MKPKLYTQTVVVDMTEEMLKELDKEALRQSTSRNQVIRNIIAKGLIFQKQEE